MTVRKMRTPRPSKAKLETGRYDKEFSAILYFMWKAGQLKSYPLDTELYPDNEDTEKQMSLEMLKLKLRCECQKLEGFRDRMIKK